MELSAPEARVLGCLVEKQKTTPDLYPLTLTALVAACNQRSNRNPVVTYDEGTVLDALRSLQDRELVGIARASGGRTVRYAHRAETVLAVDEQQLTLVTLLMLRGPQTPGELRARSERYLTFRSVDEVEEVLTGLISRDHPLVERLPRNPGQKEHRYRCLLLPGPVEETQTHPAGALEGRLAELERRVARLEAELGLET